MLELHDKLSILLIVIGVSIGSHALALGANTWSMLGGLGLGIVFVIAGLLP